MPTVRDSQRQRVYDAERVLHPPKPDFKTVEECQAYVDGLSKTVWWQSRYPNKQIRVKPGVEGTRAHASGSTVTLPSWARSRFVILHEVTHCVAPGQVWHGPEYARIMVSLVERFLGKDAARLLRQRYRQFKVKTARGLEQPRYDVKLVRAAEQARSEYLAEKAKVDALYQRWQALQDAMRQSRAA